MRLHERRSYATLAGVSGRRKCQSRNPAYDKQHGHMSTLKDHSAHAAEAELQGLSMKSVVRDKVRVSTEKQLLKHEPAKNRSGRA